MRIGLWISRLRTGNGVKGRKGVGGFLYCWCVMGPGGCACELRESEREKNCVMPNDDAVDFDVGDNDKTTTPLCQNDGRALITISFWVGAFFTPFRLRQNAAAARRATPPGKAYCILVYVLLYSMYSIVVHIWYTIPDTRSSQRNSELTNDICTQFDYVAHHSRDTIRCRVG